MHPLLSMDVPSDVQKVKHLYPFLERGTFSRNGTGTLYFFSQLESKGKERPFSKGFNGPFKQGHECKKLSLHATLLALKAMKAGQEKGCE